MKYWDYVKKCYRLEKDYDQILMGLVLFLFVSFILTGENLKLLMIFGGLTVVYMLGIPLAIYCSKKRKNIIEKKQDFVKQEYLSLEFETIDMILSELEKYDNANKVGALIETGKKISEKELKDNLHKHEEKFETAIHSIDSFYYKNGQNIKAGFFMHNLKKSDFIKRKAYIDKWIGVLDNPPINEARAIGKEWIQLSVSIAGGYILGIFDRVIEDKIIINILSLGLLVLLCIILMLMSSIFHKQSMKNKTITYYGLKDALLYERNILDKIIEA